MKEGFISSIQEFHRKGGNRRRWIIVFSPRFRDIVLVCV